MPTRPDPCWQQHLTEALERRGRVWGAGNYQRLREVSLEIQVDNGIVRDADDPAPPRRLIPFMKVEQ